MPLESRIGPNLFPFATFPFVEYPLLLEFSLQFHLLRVIGPKIVWLNLILCIHTPNDALHPLVVIQMFFLVAPHNHPDYHQRGRFLPRRTSDRVQGLRTINDAWPDEGSGLNGT